MPVGRNKTGQPLGGVGAEAMTRTHALVLDDRLLSKQYITGKLDDRIDDTVYGAGWDGITDRAPSVNAVYDKINSMGTYTHEWTHESATLTDKVRAGHTGNYGFGLNDDISGGVSFSDITHTLTLHGGNTNVSKDVGLFLGGGGASNARGIFFSNTAGGAYIGIEKTTPTSGDFNVGSILNMSSRETNSANDTTDFSFGTHSRITMGGNVPTGDDPMLVVAGSGGTAQPTLSDMTGGVQIGQEGGNGNIGFGNSSNTSFIQARQTTFDPTVAAAQTLKINALGGSVELGDSSSTITSKGNMVVDGNLTVSGTATALETAQITAEDPFILINSASSGGDVDSGIEVERGDVLTNRKLFWDEGEDAWKIQTGDSTFTAIAGGGGTLTGTNTGDVTIVLASGVPTGAVTISSQAVTLGNKFVYNEGTTNTIGVDGGADGKLAIYGTTGNSGTNALTLEGGNSAASAAALTITGHLEADTKSFNIPHPLDSNKRLVYGCLEGPEYGMYQRGSFLVDDERRIVAIDLPNYWYKMVHDDYAVNLTTYGDYNVWISNRDENGFWVETNAKGEWSFDWSVIGGRKDAKMVVEPDA